VSPAHVPPHAARVVVQMVAVGALELRSAVHHLVTVYELRVRVAVRTVRTAVDRRLATAATVVAQNLNVRLLRTENTTRPSRNGIKYQQYDSRLTSTYITINVYGRPFAKRFARCCRTVVSPVLSVTLVYCGQTVGWIKMKLGVQVDLGPGHIVLDGEWGLSSPQLSLPKKGRAPKFSAMSIAAKRLDG